MPDGKSRSRMSVDNSKIGGPIEQSSNADISDQNITNSTAASARQENHSEGGFSFGGGRAYGKWGIIALAIVLIGTAIIGLLKIIM
ncbi:hypothetical protein CBA19CS22_18030 [Caballeronia novacaledonica]|uniref:Uncharacterized protein n=1 Tax=Caballeronia novacaledonica TaxID=1544861 RepID=A0ACB5QTH3_9BURK|nr:hypothetical protein CBA19CS22_18030 [Caballeronia novacaledonica]